jgi:Fe-S oxidoreductase
LSLSRPDIAAKMVDKKAEALQEALKDPETPNRILTNCPSCVQGLGRQAPLGIRTKHIAVELAEKTGGLGWKDEAKKLFMKAEPVNF